MSSMPQHEVPVTDRATAALVEGRTLMRVNLWRIFWVSAVVAFFASRATGAGSSAWLRLGAIALMCLLVYRGLRWALWLLGAFTVLAGALMVVLAFTTPGMQLFDRALFAVLGAVQVIAFVILVKAPSVRAFMASQREPPSKAGP
jgi:hypothetical protein